MPGKAQSESLTIEGRQLNVHWKSPRFGEWLAWCYVPAASMLHQDGVGFEARAQTAEAAREALLEKVRAHLQGGAAASSAARPPES